MMKDKEIRDFFPQKIRILDGSMGALLSSMGVEAVCPDIVSLESPDIIKKIHRDYIEAGADIIITDTFGTNRIKLSRHGLFGKTEEITRAAVRNASEASAGRALVALDLGPTGELLAPLGGLQTRDAVDCYRDMVSFGTDADLAIIETMTDIAEARAAMLGAKAAGMPFAASFSFEESGRTMTGGTPECAAVIASSLGACAVGMNCSGGPEHMLGPIKAMRSVTDVPVIVQPNAGLPEMKNGRTVYPLGPQAFAEKMKDILDAGASAVGGCCGTTPEHIRLLAMEAAAFAPSPDGRHGTGRYICSSRKYASLEDALSAYSVFDDPDDLYDIDEDTRMAVLDITGVDAEGAASMVRDAVMASQIPLGFAAASRETLEAALLEYAGIAAVFCAEELSDICAEYGAIRVSDQA